MDPKPITIVLDDKRRKVGLWWQKLQHAVGGVPLLVAGLHRVQAPGGRGDVLAIVEIVVAAALLVLLARDLRSDVRVLRSRMPSPDAHPPAHGHAHPDWFDVVAGILLIVESVHTASLGGKAFYARPVFLLGVVTLALGLLHGRLKGFAWKRRQLRLDQAGIHARLSPLRRFTVPWSEVTDVRLTASTATIETTTGSRALALDRYLNSGEIRAALEEWRDHRSLSASD